MGTAVLDPQGQTLGHVREFAVAPIEDSAHVYGIVLKRSQAVRGDRPSLVRVTDLKLTANGIMQMREGGSATVLPDDETYLLLERDLLDQQIIDVNGHKVVRVNDVDLVWEHMPRRHRSTCSLRIAEVEVGHARSGAPPAERPARHRVDSLPAASRRPSSPGTSST